MIVMKKAEIWETAFIIISIVTLWPVIKWHNARQSVPLVYYVMLLVVLGVLAFITVRRIKKLRKALREAKSRREKLTF